ncbi:MAG: hypothetical protein ABR577_08555 [Pyrinomonadaceae bacterium]
MPLPVSLVMNIGFDGNVWRAVFVAALALIAFALAHYWKSLHALAPRRRTLLIVLRGLVLVLVAAALAGLRVERETTAPPRVLVYHDTKRIIAATRNPAPEKAATENAARVSAYLGELDAAGRELSDALAEKNIESVIVDAAREPATSQGGGGAFVAGIFLTNGALTADEARRAIEETGAAAFGAPVYVAATFGAGFGRGRVALQSVVPVSSTAARGVPVAVRCVVHGRGMSGRESLITITDDTGAVRASAKVLWINDDEWQTASLEIVPKTIGWINYTAQIEKANEEDSLMLAHRFALHVEERRVRVLFFEGAPTWEAKFIRRALTQAGMFDVDYFAQVSRVSIAGITGVTKKQKGEDTNHDAASTPTDRLETNNTTTSKDAPEAKLHESLGSAARLNTYDCIIVGATPNEMLSVAEAARLRDWVERRGGGLIVLGGNSFAGSIAAPNGKLYSLLPSEIDGRGLLASELQIHAQGVPVEADDLRGGTALTPTQAGANGALGGYRNARETEAAQQPSAAKTALLSGEGFRLGALRSGASVLATSGGSGANGMSETGAPLIAALRSGAGRVIVFAPADSWRIRTTSVSAAADDAGGAFGALWQGIVWWAAAGARAFVELTLNEDSPSAESEVSAQLRVRDALFAAAKIERVSARLQKALEDGEQNAANNAVDESSEIAFVPDAQDASLWRGRFHAPANSGRFNLEIVYTLANGTKGNVAKSFAVVASSTLDVGTARDTLSRAARETGGELFDASNARAFAAKLAGLPRGDAKLLFFLELRAWWPLAVIISLLLGGEWFARRRWRVD